MEARRLLATFTVTNADASGSGSLRQAIIDSNNSTGLNTIAFNIPGPGVHTISPVGLNQLSLLPITNPVVIDGYSQPGASRNTLAGGDNAVLLIALNGAGAGSTADGLEITGGGSTVQGLVIYGYGAPNQTSGGHAIYIHDVGGNTIRGNFLGTDPTGTAGQGNKGLGVLIDNSSSNVIGGTTPPTETSSRAILPAALVLALIWAPTRRAT